MDVNVEWLLICVRAMSAAMTEQGPRSTKSRNGTREIGRGAIVNVASAKSYAGLPGKTAYMASKHAVIGITKNVGTRSFSFLFFSFFFFFLCPWTFEIGLVTDVCEQLSTTPPTG